MARANLGFKTITDTSNEVDLVHFAEDGTETTVGQWNASVIVFTAAGGMTVTGALTATGLLASAGLSSSSLIVASASDVRVTAGNFRAGAVSAFATTEPTSALVMKQGTAPAGAITTSGGIFSNGTVVQKIIAAGTVSNVET